MQLFNSFNRIIRILYWNIFPFQPQTQKSPPIEAVCFFETSCMIKSFFLCRFICSEDPSTYKWSPLWHQRFPTVTRKNGVVSLFFCFVQQGVFVLEKKNPSVRTWKTNWEFEFKSKTPNLPTSLRKHFYNASLFESNLLQWAIFWHSNFTTCQFAKQTV